jgi:hypothetical protein
MGKHKRRRPVSPLKPRCVRLFDGGRRACDIARTLHVTSSTVQNHLLATGHDPMARRQTAAKAERERFAAAWNAAADLSAIAKAERATEPAVQSKASRLRGMGYRLKRMPPRRLADTKTARILRLHRRGGLTTAAIARRVGAEPEYVRAVLWRAKNAGAGRG